MKILSTLFFLYFGISPINAQNINLDIVDSIFNTAYQSRMFSGQVFITQSGETVFKKKYGFANLDKQIAFTDSTSFQIASITKHITAVSIFYLEEKGKLSIDEPVNKYLKEFPYDSITIWHLLSHTSGLPNLWSTISADMDKSKNNGNKELLKLLEMKQYALRSRPGDLFEYADINFNLLALIIERVSELDYDFFLKQTFFQPLGMKHTKAELILDTRLIDNSRLATGYEYDTITNALVEARSLEKNDYIHWVAKFYGDGDITTTGHDLLLFDEALLRGDLISQKNLEKIKEPILLNSGKTAMEWGYPMAISGTFIKNKNFSLFQKAGGIPGYRTKLIHVENEDITILIMSNLESNWFWEIDVFSFLTDE